MTPLCTFPECARPLASRGYCVGHLYHLRKGNPLKQLREYVKGGGSGTCSVEACGRPARGKGLCSPHRRIQRAGGQLIPLKQIGPRGAGCVDKKGYRRFKAKRADGSSTSISAHRRVMQEYVGRPLLKVETVHHVNGVKDDNRIENLELWSSSHPAGQRVQDKVAWALEILALYGDFVQPEQLAAAI